MTNPFIFDFSNLKGDFLGGLTAGIVALPLLGYNPQEDTQLVASRMVYWRAF